MEENIGNRFQQVRRYTKKTQKGFAESLGVTQTTISGIEKGTANPSLTLIKLICATYGISEDWLTLGTGKMLYFPAEWDTRTPDGLLKRYEAMKISFEKRLSGCTTDTVKLRYLVESFAYLVSLLSAARLPDEKETSYLCAVRKLIDSLEKFSFQCSLLEKRNKPDYASLYSLKVIEEKTQKIVCESMQEIYDIYRNNAKK